MKQHFTRSRLTGCGLVLLTPLIAAGCGGGPPPETPAAQTAPVSTTPGDIEVRMDRVAAARRGVSSDMVSTVLADFLTHRPKYTLSELNDLIIHRPAGSEPVRLRDVATIEVAFGPARTSIEIDE